MQNAENAVIARNSKPDIHVHVVAKRSLIGTKSAECKEIKSIDCEGESSFKT